MLSYSICCIAAYTLVSPLDIRDRGSRPTRCTALAHPMSLRPAMVGAMNTSRRPYTVADFLAGQHQLELYCRHCDLRIPAPLDRLAREGWALTPIARLRIRCERCGGPTQRLIRVAKPSAAASEIPQFPPPTLPQQAQRLRGTFSWNI